MKEGHSKVCGHHRQKKAKQKAEKEEKRFQEARQKVERMQKQHVDDQRKTVELRERNAELERKIAEATAEEGLRRLKDSHIQEEEKLKRDIEAHDRETEMQVDALRRERAVDAVRLKADLDRTKQDHLNEQNTYKMKLENERLEAAEAERKRKEEEDAAKAADLAKIKHEKDKQRSAEMAEQHIQDTMKKIRQLLDDARPNPELLIPRQIGRTAPELVDLEKKLAALGDTPSKKDEYLEPLQRLSAEIQKAKTSIAETARGLAEHQCKGKMDEIKDIVAAHKKEADECRCGTQKRVLDKLNNMLTAKEKTVESNGMELYAEPFKRLKTIIGEAYAYIASRPVFEVCYPQKHNGADGEANAAAAPFLGLYVNNTASTPPFRLEVYEGKPIFYKEDDPDQSIVVCWDTKKELWQFACTNAEIVKRKKLKDGYKAGMDPDNPDRPPKMPWKKPSSVKAKLGSLKSSLGASHLTIKYST